MSNPAFRRNATRALLVLHFIGLTLVIGIRFANFGIEHATTHGSLQSLAWGRDLMGVLARSLTLPGFLLTIATGIGLVIVRYGKRVPRWVWAKVALTTVALAMAVIFVGPALEAARKWAHWSLEHGRLAPQFQGSLAQVSLYGGIVFTLILLTIPVAVWKPALASGMRKPATVKPITK
jgi:hypothetical protein